MHWQHTPYTIPLLLSAATAAAVGLLVLKYRAAAGALALSVLFAAVASWAFEYAMEMAAAEQSFKLFWANLQYLSISSVPVLWMIFALQYTDRGQWAQLKYVGPLWIVPLITVVLAWTDPLHGLLRSRIDLILWDGFNLLAMVEYGPWFWIQATYSYVLMGVGTLLLVPTLLRHSDVYRGQAITLLIGLLAPWVANAVYIFGYSPFPYLDLTPFAFLLQGLAGAWGLFGYQLFDVVPVARHAVVEELRDGVIVIDARDRVVDANPTAQDLLNLQSGEYIGLPAPQVLAPLEALVFPLEEEGAIAGEINLERTGENRCYELQLSALRDRRDRQTGHLIVLHDITERKRAEEDLIRSQRLRAAGELSLGVSHNLNNILTGIIGPTHQLQELIQDPKATKHLETVITSAQRAKDLIQRLGHTVEGENEAELEPVALERAVPEAIEGARPRWQDEATRIGRTIEVHSELGNVPRVAADPSGLHDILLNLIFNAVDAMPEGGAITIRTSYRGDEAELSCSDSGTGMDEATRQRIFEPFFTTKADVGTGLGLATAHNTIQQWGGRIEVDSAPDQGTTFHIYLPLWQGPIPEEETPSVEVIHAAVDPAKPARVLLVEDEAIIGMMVESGLRDDGHEVIAATRGDEGIEHFAPGAFDLLIVDLGIPDKPGDELARLFKGQDPKLATLLITGWNLKEDDPRRQPFDGYVRKPFNMAQVRRMIAEILSARTAS